MVLRLLSNIGCLSSRDEQEYSLTTYSLFNNNRLHRRRLPRPPPLERPPQTSHQSSPQPAHGPWCHHRRRLLRPHFLLLGNTRRRLHLGRCRKRPDPHSGSKFRNHRRLRAYNAPTGPVPESKGRAGEIRS